MNKRFSLLAAGIIALLFSACSDNVVESGSPIEAKLTVLVKDASTGEPLAATSVKLLSTGKSATTDAAGIAVFKDVYVGSHRLLIEKADYAAAVHDAEINGYSGVASEESVLVTLYPLTAGLDGYLFYENEGIEAVAAGATVRIQLNSDNFVQKIYDVTVGADGKFTFEGLPAVGIDYRLFALEHTFNGAIYGTKSLTAISLAPGTVVRKETHEKYSSDASLFVLLGYSNVVSSTDDVVFEFSDDIDVGSLTSASLNIDNNQVADKIWSGKTLTLKPAGKWGASSFNVTFTGVKSVKGKLFPNASYKVTALSEDLSASKVAGLVNTNTDDLNYDGGSVRLKWDEVPGATSYEIYRKGTGEENFNFIGSPLDLAFPTRYIDNIDLRGGIEYEYLVQAKNTSSRTLLTGITPVKVFDKVKPELSYLNYYNTPDTVYSEINASALNYTTSNDYQISSIQFNEPMDTVATLTIACAPAVARATVTREWSIWSDQQLTLKVKITAGDAVGAAVNSLCTVSGLKDKRGNAFTVEFEDPADATKTRNKGTLDFRLTN